MLNLTLSSGLIDLDGSFLPVGKMRLISRVTGLDDSTVAGEADLGAEHWVYADHFPGDPIFPGTLMIEAAGQLVALWAWAQGQRGRPRLVRTNAQFHTPVLPSAPNLLLRAHVRRRHHLYFAKVQLSVAETPVAIIALVLAVLPAA